MQERYFVAVINDKVFIHHLQPVLYIKSQMFIRYCCKKREYLPVLIIQLMDQWLKKSLLSS